jgi:hypothetical protein
VFVFIEEAEIVVNKKSFSQIMVQKMQRKNMEDMRWAYFTTKFKILANILLLQLGKDK